MSFVGDRAGLTSHKNYILYKPKGWWYIFRWTKI